MPRGPRPPRVRGTSVSPPARRPQPTVRIRDRQPSASKVFQSILSGRPIFSLLHQNSEALDILHSSESGAFSVGYAPGQDLQDDLESALQRFWTCTEWAPNTAALEPHSASNAAATLAEAFNQCLAS